jgi:acetate kinase
MRLLSVNTGSSSLKAALYAVGSAPALIYSCAAESIGAASSRFRIRDADGQSLFRSESAAQTHAAALTAFLHWLGQQGPEGEFAAVAHRLVVASQAFLAPRELDSAAMAELDVEQREAPDHLPQAIAAIQAVRRIYPSVPQIGCSDSAFHAPMPAEARTVPLPGGWRGQGIERFGYHGLSCASVLATLQGLDPKAALGRVIVAHLGNGASITAVRAGRSVDTTMGLTPCGGLIMSSRTGDLDPGVVVYLQSRGMTATQVNHLVNHQGGLLGISGISGDMRTLLVQAESNPQARLAVACFLWQARKHLAAMAASLGGVDCLVFAGGIGENAPAVRADICRGMEWMGLQVDAARNARGAPVISPDGSAVSIRVIATDENQELARQGAGWLSRHPRHQEK